MKCHMQSHHPGTGSHWDRKLLENRTNLLVEENTRIITFSPSPPSIDRNS